MPYTYAYPRPALTVDCAVVGFDGRLRVLLIQRGGDPFAGCWALPGGFVDENEPLLAAAQRELAEETGLRGVPLEQLATFGDPGRDPRGHTVSVVFLGMIRIGEHRPQAADDAQLAQWHSLHNPPPLAFDHRQILRAVRRALQRKAVCEPFGLELLPQVFSADQLVGLYQQVLRRTVDHRKLLRRLKSLGLLAEADIPAGKPQRRKHKWLSFNVRQYRKLQRTGLPCGW